MKQCRDVVSYSDGKPSHGTGIPYFYLTTLDPTARYALKDHRSSFTTSEYLLGTCGKIDPENPSCSKITLTGKVGLLVLCWWYDLTSLTKVLRRTTTYTSRKQYTKSYITFWTKFWLPLHFQKYKTTHTFFILVLNYTPFYSHQDLRPHQLKWTLFHKAPTLGYNWATSPLVKC